MMTAIGELRTKIDLLGMAMLLNHKNWCPCLNCVRRQTPCFDENCWMCNFYDQYNEASEHGALWYDESDYVAIDDEDSFFGYSYIGIIEIPF